MSEALRALKEIREDRIEQSRRAFADHDRYVGFARRSWEHHVKLNQEILELEESIKVIERHEADKKQAQAITYCQYDLACSKPNGHAEECDE